MNIGFESTAVAGFGSTMTYWVLKNSTSQIELKASLEEYGAVDGQIKSVTAGAENHFEIKA